MASDPVANIRVGNAVIDEAESSIARARSVIDQMSRLIHSELSRLRVSDLQQYRETLEEAQVIYRRKRDGAVVPPESRRRRKPALIRHVGGQREQRVGEMIYDPVARQWRGNDVDSQSFSPASSPRAGIVRPRVGPMLITPNSPQFLAAIQSAATVGKAAGMVFDENSGTWRTADAGNGGEGDFDEFAEFDVDSPNDTSDWGSGQASDSGFNSSVHAGLSDMNAAAMQAAKGSGMVYDRERLMWVAEGGGANSSDSDPFGDMSEEDDQAHGKFTAVGEFDVDDATLESWRRATRKHRSDLRGWFRPAPAGRKGGSADSPADLNDDRAFLQSIRSMALSRLVAQAITYRVGADRVTPLGEDLGGVSDSDEMEQEAMFKRVEVYEENDFDGDMSAGDMLNKLRARTTAQRGVSMGESESDWGSPSDDQGASSDGKVMSDDGAPSIKARKPRRKHRRGIENALDDIDTGFGSDSAGEDATVSQRKDDRDRDTPQSVPGSKPDLDAWREETIGRRSLDAYRESPIQPVKASANKASARGSITPELFARKGGALAAAKPASNVAAWAEDESDDDGFGNDPASVTATPPVVLQANKPANSISAWAEDTSEDDGFGEAPTAKAAPSVPSGAKKGLSTITPAMMSKMGTITPDMMASMMRSQQSGPQPASLGALKGAFGGKSANVGGSDSDDSFFNESDEDAKPSQTDVGLKVPAAKLTLVNSSLGSKQEADKVSHVGNSDSDDSFFDDSDGDDAGAAAGTSKLVLGELKSDAISSDKPPVKLAIGGDKTNPQQQQEADQSDDSFFDDSDTGAAPTTLSLGNRANTRKSEGFDSDGEIEAPRKEPSLVELRAQAAEIDSDFEWAETTELSLKRSTSKMPSADELERIAATNPKGGVTTESGAENDDDIVEEVEWPELASVLSSVPKPELVKRLDAARRRTHEGGSPKQQTATRSEQNDSEEEEDWDDLG